MSAEARPGGGAGIGAGVGSVGSAGMRSAGFSAEAGIGVSSPVIGSISSPITEYSTALDTISGKSGGSFDRSASVTDIFSAPEYRISQSAFNLDTATPYSIEMPAENALPEDIETMIRDTAKDLTVEPATIVNEVRYSLAPNESPVKDPLSDIFQETVPLVAQYKHTDTAIRDLESLKTEFETLYVVNPEITTRLPEVEKEAEPAVTQKPENESAQKTKAVFKEYAATYILPNINEITTSDESQLETAPEVSSILKVVDGEFQLALQEIAEENKKEKLELTVKDQVELRTDVEQAVKIQELYIAIGYQTDAAAALATHALHQTLARKGLEVKVADQVINAAETLQKTKDQPITKTELAPLVDDRAKKEVKKKINEDSPDDIQYFALDEKALLKRVNTSSVVSQQLEQQTISQAEESQKPEVEYMISAEDYAKKMIENEIKEENSQIIPDGPDGSLRGSDGLYRAINQLKPDTPRNMDRKVKQLIESLPPVKRTRYQENSVTKKDVQRVLEGEEIIRAKVIFDRSQQKTT
ncbi:MAG: hypothetical protein Q7K55_08155 [Candidatus Levybacteria bacterium]|nr:hypothetical protein [Candidatus Levybacteria bacterium]